MYICYSWRFNTSNQNSYHHNSKQDASFEWWIEILVFSYKSAGLYLRKKTQDVYFFIICTTETELKLTHSFNYVDMNLQQEFLDMQLN